MHMRRWSSGLLTVAGLVALAGTACGRKAPPTDAANWEAARDAMIQTIRNYGVTNERVIRAMAKVRRHAFIPAAYRRLRDPYGDHPCSIGYGQTITQPFIVAHMTACIDPQPGEKVLEIGTGSGYQAAILAELGAEVYSIEIIPELAEHARQALAAEGYPAVRVLTGDGYRGWPEHAPFDAVIITCAPEEIPGELVAQLREGGRAILPLGATAQRLIILRKQGGRVIEEANLPVVFVPMVHGR